MKIVLQSVLLPKSKYSLEEAKRWINSNGYHVNYRNKKIDITEHYYRFRQAKPEKNSIVRYYTKIAKGGIKFVYYVKE